MENENLQNLESTVAAVFLSHFHRAPDFESMLAWQLAYRKLIEDQGNDPAALPNAFKAFSALLYEEASNNPEHRGSNADYVQHVYEAMLGRPADAEGFDYWVEQLNSGAIVRGELAAIMIAAAQNDTRDAAYIANRVEVAREFSIWGNSNPNILPWLQYDAAQILEGVNEDAATIAAAMARMHSAEGPSGEAFNLTTDVDDIRGTEDDDVINAYWVDAGGEEASTFTAGDSIDGGAGRDTLNIYTDATAGFNNAFPQDAIVQHVEVVNIFNQTGQVSDLADASRYAGVQELWQVGEAATVTNLADDVIAGFRASLADASLVVHPDNAAQSVTVQLDDVSDEIWELIVTADEDSCALHTLNLSGTLHDESDDGLNGIFVVVRPGVEADTFTLNTSLNVDFVLLDNGSTVSTLDASGSTGDILYFMPEGMRNVTAGTGDDTIVFDAQTPLTVDHNIDGGDGYDIVAIDQASFDDADYDAINRLQNIEQLDVDAADLDLDAGRITSVNVLSIISGVSVIDDPDAIELTHAIVRNLSSDQTLEVWAFNELEDYAGYVELQGGASDVTVQGVNGEENTETGFYLTVDAGGNDTRGTLTLLGDTWISFSNLDATFSVIDASQLDGGIDLSVWDSIDDTEPATGMSSVVAETIVLGDGSDWITLGVSFDDAILSSSTIDKLDIIEGFNSIVEEGSAHDILLGITRTIELQLSDDVDSLEAAFAEAAANYGVDDSNEVDVLYFHFEGDTYLYADTSTAGGGGIADGNDFAIKLVGTHDMSQQELIEYPY